MKSTTLINTKGLFKRATQIAVFDAILIPCVWATFQKEDHKKWCLLKIAQVAIAPVLRHLPSAMLLPLYIHSIPVNMPPYPPLSTVYTYMWGSSIALKYLFGDRLTKPSGQEAKHCINTLESFLGLSLSTVFTTLFNEIMCYEILERLSWSPNIQTWGNVQMRGWEESSQLTSSHLVSSSWLISKDCQVRS